MLEFDIIEYMSGLTGFVFDKAVLKRIAFDRGVANMPSYEYLTQEHKDLILADLLYVAYTSPNVWASSSMAHGSFSKTVGPQTVYNKEQIYDMMYSIYKKYDDDKLDELKSSGGTLQWLPL